MGDTKETEGHCSHGISLKVKLKFQGTVSLGRQSNFRLQNPTQFFRAVVYAFCPSGVYSFAQMVT